jgi:AraC-like DNA-binding protein
MTARAAWPVFAGIDFTPARVFETDDADEAQRLCAQSLGPENLRVQSGRGPFKARLERMEVGPLALCRFAWPAGISVDLGPLDDYYLLCLPRLGGAEYEHGQRWFSAEPGQPGLVGGARFRFFTRVDFEPVMVLIKREAVDTAWMALSGEMPRHAICFHGEMPTNGDAWRAVEPMLRLLAAEAQSSQPPAPVHLHARLQDVLITALLLNQPHSHSQRQVPSANATPWRVRRAQGYMLERLEEPLTLSAVALAVGLPTRTLQWAFKSAEGLGPMQWLRQLRLHAVREALLANGEASPRVADTALRFGFSHLGEFSQSYRRAFGECPRETLNRRR